MTETLSKTLLTPGLQIWRNIFGGKTGSKKAQMLPSERVSSLVAAARGSLYMCLWACEKSQVKILPHP